MPGAMTLETAQDLRLGKPGATEKAIYLGRGAMPVSCTYKVAGNLFGVIAFRSPGIILKCEETRATALRDHYEGIGHRSHLGARFWNSARLDADVDAGRQRRRRGVWRMASRCWPRWCSSCSRPTFTNTAVWACTSRPPP